MCSSSGSHDQECQTGPSALCVTQVCTSRHRSTVRRHPTANLQDTDLKTSLEADDSVPVLGVLRHTFGSKHVVHIQTSSTWVPRVTALKSQRDRTTNGPCHAAATCIHPKFGYGLGANICFPPKSHWSTSSLFAGGGGGSGRNPSSSCTMSLMS